MGSSPTMVVTYLFALNNTNILSIINATSLCHNERLLSNISQRERIMNCWHGTFSNETLVKFGKVNFTMPILNIYEGHSNKLYLQL